MLSRSVVSSSLLPMDCSLWGSSVHGDSPGKNIGVGCHALLQRIFPTQESNPGLPHCWRILNILATREALKNIKSNKGKWQITFKGTPFRLSAHFSTETLQARREWHDLLKVMKGKNLQPRILYGARLSFRFDGEIKGFLDKQKLREFSTTKPALQQMLKELL